MKAIIVVNSEIQGNVRKFDKYFKEGKITFSIDSFKSELIPNECGDLYTIIDMNIEQGRRFIVSVVVGFEIDKKCRLDNFGKIFSVAKGCNMSVVDTKVVSVVIC